MDFGYPALAMELFAHEIDEHSQKNSYPLFI
jgi:hypothetical protein